MNKKKLIYTIILLLIGSILLINPIYNISTRSKGFENKEKKNKFQYYNERYKVKCLKEKITDNFGKGFESLYGTRNMRTILYGVAYRGGANNFYHKFNKRDNHNPLPPDGLKNLSDEGFSTAVYLYNTNYSNSIKSIVNENNGDTLYYIQNSGNNRKDLERIMLMVLKVINTPTLGPIYFHCWNGWHQSGYISAAILMQFCNFTNKEAYQYWLDNTDGVNKGYAKVKSQVKSFMPFDNIVIEDSVKKQICPCNN